MQEKLLIPLDGSKVGEAALPVIEGLITRFSPEVKVEVVLLGVVASLTHWVVVGETSAPISYTEEELKLIKHRITDYLDRAGETLRSKGASVTTMVSSGNAADEIVKAAHETGADMIAMSTHGRSGLSRLAFGSITAKVLREASVPVITVRAPEGTANA